jgi:O-antigen/teichoic acid export membrane protein
MVKKSEIIWNTLGSFVESLLSAVLLMFCTRLNGTEIAGMFSISFATATILNAIGDFGIRIYQVTDTNRKYKFGDYLLARVFVVITMVIIGILFVNISGYTAEKLWICIALIMFKVIDNLSETYQGEFQLRNRLDLGGKSMVIRVSSSLIVFFITDVITKNVIFSCITFVLTNLTLFLLWDVRILSKFQKLEIKYDKNNIKEILLDCLPLAISTGLSLYIINATKYAIDNFGDYTMQTYFNVIYMPTFVINLVSAFVIKPFLKPFGDLWNSKEYLKFIKSISLIILILAGATICIDIACALLGVPVLSFIYGIDLSPYKIEMLLLVISGFFYASATVMLYALSTIRKQKLTTIAYIITSVIALISSNICVNKWQMKGAIVSNMITTVTLFVLLVIFFLYELKKSKMEK